MAQSLGICLRYFISFLSLNAEFGKRKKSPNEQIIRRKAWPRCKKPNWGPSRQVLPDSADWSTLASKPCLGCSEDGTRWRWARHQGEIFRATLTLWALKLHQVQNKSLWGNQHNAEGNLLDSFKHYFSHQLHSFPWLHNDNVHTFLHTPRDDWEGKEV